MNGGRAYLNELSDEQFASIFRDAPSIAEIWAPLVGVKRDALVSGSSRGVRALRVAVARIRHPPPGTDG